MGQPAPPGRVSKCCEHLDYHQYLSSGETMIKLKLIDSTEKPGPTYVEVTHDLVPIWEKLLNDFEKQAKDIDLILKKAGYVSKRKKI